MKQFQEDLQNGMTLEDALRKHNLTFKEAVHECNRITSKKGVRYQRTHHIYKNANKYRVEKQIRKKRIQIQTDTYEDAVIIRDYLEEHGWTTENIEKIRRKMNS